ncbi:MAG: hypothetical protein KKD92_14025 [Proteobacteria bacterium]|nr:hypothetical protein [Pseudomonadota bacterium]
MSKINKLKNKTISSLRPAEYNPRKITPKQLDMLGRSMKEYGDLSGIVFNTHTGQLVGGHQRIKHLDPTWNVVKRKHSDSVGTVALGEIETPFGIWSYREVNWPLEKEKAANVAANQHGGYFDMPKLRDLLIEIDSNLMDMESIGFDEGELSDLLVSEEEFITAFQTADKTIEALTVKIRKIAGENPKKMNDALAVVVQNGSGNNVLFLIDPCTKDIVAELKRYAESGEHSALECLIRSLLL